MAKFILTKVPDENCRGAEVTYTFESEHLPHAQGHIRTFLEASGFVFPEDEQDSDDFEFRVTSDDFLASEEDYMWDEALVSKFGEFAANAAQPVNDGILGGGGADVISLSEFQLGDK